MMTFLFWNTNGNSVHRIIGEIVEMYEVDIVILSECKIDETELIEELSQKYRFVRSKSHFENTRVPIYVRDCKDRLKLEAVKDTSHLSIQRIIRHKEAGEILIVAVHLPSKKNYEIEDLRGFAEQSKQFIEEAEQLVGHTNTIVVGDFNMNPFDEGLVSFNGFHSVMDKRIAQKGSRNLQGENRSFFYNPMWSLMGDISLGPPGTFYYNRGSKNYYWHMLDQVLLRPGLIPLFPDNELRVITETHSYSLLRKSGIPNSTIASDHFPLVFKIDM